MRATKERKAARGRGQGAAVLFLAAIAIQLLGCSASSHVPWYEFGGRTPRSAAAGSAQSTSKSAAASHDVPVAVRQRQLPQRHVADQTLTEVVPRTEYVKAVVRLMEALPAVWSLGAEERARFEATAREIAAYDLDTIRAGMLLCLQNSEHRCPTCGRVSVTSGVSYSLLFFTKFLFNLPGSVPHDSPDYPQYEGVAMQSTASNPQKAGGPPAADLRYPWAEGHDGRWHLVGGLTCVGIPEDPIDQFDYLRSRTDRRDIRPSQVARDSSPRTAGADGAATTAKQRVASIVLPKPDFPAARRQVGFHSPNRPGIPYENSTWSMFTDPPLSSEERTRLEAVIGLVERIPRWEAALSTEQRAQCEASSREIAAYDLETIWLALEYASNKPCPTCGTMPGAPERKLHVLVKFLFDLPQFIPLHTPGGEAPRYGPFPHKAVADPRVATGSYVIPFRWPWSEHADGGWRLTGHVVGQAVQRTWPGYSPTRLLEHYHRQYGLRQVSQ